MARKIGSHSDITGPKVRDAALRLIARHGYGSVTMRQIASEVGVQAGALYLYIRDKQSLLFDLLHEQMRGAVQRLDGLDLSGTPSAQIEAFVRAHFQYHMGGDQPAFIPYTELRNLTPANYEKLEALRVVYEQELEKIIRAGQKTGEFDIDDAKLSTLVLISILNGVLAWYDPDDRVPLAQVEDHYVSFVLKGLTAQEVRQDAPRQTTTA